MNLDARESERLWNTLARLNEQMGSLAERVDHHHRAHDKRLRRLEKRDRMVSRVGRRKDVRAGLVTALVAALMGLATYFETRAASIHAAQQSWESMTLDRNPSRRDNRVDPENRPSEAPTPRP